ncbi:MAG: S-methyl-5-thioribose-1-phosphate isomerase [Acidimicrobiales bacterium]
MRSLDWVDGALELVDQTRLPHDMVTLRIGTVADLVAAIQRLSVRGAPALGVAGAYGVVLAAVAHPPATDRAGFEGGVEALRSARPTAVNLARMVDRVADVARTEPHRVLAAAHAVRDEELAASLAMGERGADLVGELAGDGPVTVMTICNTGGLAAVERGTALAVVQTLHERGRLGEALPLETRPLLQGARLTAWELEAMGAPHRLLVDSAGPFLLGRGAADVVLIGADRIAANGDTANKIGSYSLALGAARAGVPFVVVAPTSTIDVATPDGAAIEIEDRGPAEVIAVGGTPTAPAGTAAVNPAFDVTPVDLITALVTEAGVVRFDRGERITTSPAANGSSAPGAAP